MNIKTVVLDSEETINVSCPVQANLRSVILPLKYADPAVSGIRAESDSGFLVYNGSPLMAQMLLNDALGLASAAEDHDAVRLIQAQNPPSSSTL